MTDYADAVRAKLAEAGSLEAAGLAGYVYTQLTDVEEEVNGLLTYDRRVNKTKRSLHDFLPGKGDRYLFQVVRYLNSWKRYLSPFPGIFAQSLSSRYVGYPRENFRRQETGVTNPRNLFANRRPR